MSRITAAFARLKREGRRGLIPFVVAGDPDLETTERILSELAKAGALIIELGIPFSDPMADGPVIQRASERALRNNVGIGDVLDMTTRVRDKFEDVPLVLFSYFNPLLQYGLERLSIDAAKAGIDGILITDLTPEEASDVGTQLKSKEIDLIFLVAPTSSDARLQLIAAQASGFIYAVSRAGVTGARTELSEAAERLVERVRKISSLPVVVGFGISSAAQVAETCRYADAAVVGSAIVAEIERLAGAPNLPTRIGEFAQGLLASA